MPKKPPWRIWANAWHISTKQLILIPQLNKTQYKSVHMITSWNGNIFALLALCAGNWPVTGEFPAQRPVTRSLDVFFDLRLNKRLSKQSWGWWFETPSHSFWRHCNDTLWDVLYIKAFSTLLAVSKRNWDAGLWALVLCNRKLVYIRWTSSE